MAVLTDRKAQLIRPGDRPLPHGAIVGLTLHPLKTKGRGKWMLRYVSPVSGKRRSMGLGSYPLVGIAEAAKKASDARDLIYRGIDPLDVKDSKEPEHLTFREAAIKLHEELSPSWKNEKHKSQWVNTLNDYIFPLLGDRRLDSLAPNDFADALRKDWIDKQETMMRVRQRCHAVMGWAWAHGFIQSNPLDVVGHLLPKFKKTKKHHPAMPWREIPDFYANSLQCYTRGEATRPLLIFLILTACRSIEARAAEWNEIDFKNKVWVVPAGRMKANVRHRVPLSDQCIEILDKQRGLNNMLVFPSVRDKVSSDMMLTVFLRRQNANSDTEGRFATAHGFRSSFRDWASENGYRKDLAERALAHTVENKVEAAYHRTDLLEERRGMMQAWADFIFSREDVV